jgi:hypothetical protein
MRIWKTGRAVAPLNTEIRDFLKAYDRTVPMYAVVGMVAETQGAQNVWAVFIQEDRKMIRTHRESDE